ncbi:MAG: hypothetical protein V8S36_00450, partial [Lachnospiraceae bacterium]
DMEVNLDESENEIATYAAESITVNGTGIYEPAEYYNVYMVDWYGGYVCKRERIQPIGLLLVVDETYT